MRSSMVYGFRVDQQEQQQKQGSVGLASVTVRR